MYVCVCENSPPHIVCVTGALLAHKQLTPNYALRGSIRQLQEQEERRLKKEQEERQELQRVLDRGDSPQKRHAQPLPGVSSSAGMQTGVSVDAVLAYTAGEHAQERILTQGRVIVTGDVRTGGLLCQPAEIAVLRPEQETARGSGVDTHVQRSPRGCVDYALWGVLCLAVLGLAVGVPLALLGGGYPSASSPTTPAPIAPESASSPSQTLSAVKMVFQLDMTLSDFTSDKQVKFREAVAAAAGVQMSDVTIDHIEEVAGRRQLQADSIRVDTSINVPDAAAADTLKTTLTRDKINAELQNVGLPSATILTEGQSEEAVPCSRGFTGPDGQCVKCVAGKYKETAGSTDCTLCAENTHSSVVGATSMSTCIACATTAFSPAGSASSDSCQCNAGYTGPNGGACTRCASGSYKGSAGDAGCDACPSGETSRPGSTSSQSCSRSCDPGSTGPEGGPCQLCVEGQYKTSPGSAACSSCPSKTISQTGSDELTDCGCNAGYAGPDGGPCLACAPGTHKAAMGSAACSECEAGKFSDTDAARLCANCPSNSNSVSGSDAAQDCNSAPGFTGVHVRVRVTQRVWSCVCACV